MSFDNVNILEQGRSRSAHLSFIKEMHLRGARLEKDDLLLLREHEVVTFEDIEEALASADITETAAVLDRYVLTREIYEARCIVAGFTEKWNDEAIFKEHWTCDSPAEFDEGFKAHINSHFRRFCDLSAYEPLWLYATQAERWLAEPEPDLTGLDFYEQFKYWQQEFERISVNSYYAVARYGYYKESSSEGGEDKFVCNLAHIWLMYLIDSGRSGYVGKPRQMASTTLLMLVAAIKMIVRRNVHVKLIACDLETTEEIFEDKLKYGFGRFEEWMKPVVINDSGKLFRVGFRASDVKGSRKALTSKLSIVAPKVSAINGGAPDIIFVDEAVFLEFFNEMVKEGRPTIFVKDKATGRLKMKRQLWCWGTGGRSAKGGGSFEREHRGLFEKWASNDTSEGIVPIFFDWTCRTGIDVAHYLSEQKAYKAGRRDGETQRSVEDREILFRQHYPSSLDDMYSVSASTLVPVHFITRMQARITALPEGMRPMRGYFQPVYGNTPNPPGSFLRANVVDVQFVQVGEHNLSAPVEMFWEPYRNWKDRYYHYTDPIVSDEGLSMHSGAIWDEEFKSVACIVNMRTDDPYDSYVQDKLMGMYYRNHGQQYAPHLIENNIGKTMIKYMQGHEWQATRSLVTQFFLPSYLQGGGDDIGIDTKAERKRHVVELGKVNTLQHGRNIFLPTFWSQMRTFTGRTSGSGKTTYQAEDRKKNRDDVVDAVFGVWVCRMCFQGRMPVQVDVVEAEKSPRRREYALVFDPTTWQTRRVMKSVRKTKAPGVA